MCTLLLKVYYLFTQSEVLIFLLKFFLEVPIEINTGGNPPDKQSK